MTPETYDKVYDCFEIVLVLEIIIIIGLIWASVWPRIVIAMYPTPEVIEYFQNCNNLTLYPQGCQVQT